jgi:uncharacterized protein YndB with AHSA1/START domain/uncharacterized protein YciI
MSASPNSRARAVADVNRGTILAVVEIAAAAQKIFDALTSSEVTRWWGSPDTYQTTEWQAEVRPGGKWRAGGVSADGRSLSVRGEYLEVSPPTRLVQTWVADWDGGNTTTITYELSPIDGGTRLTLWHEGFAGRPQSCAGHAHGWERVFGWLTAYASEEGKLSHFLCRLIPPRPDFAQTINALEKSAMSEHAKYWAGKLQEGIVVAFGPVLDPRGVWGVGIVRAKDEASVEAMRDADPAMVADIGMRYEILPMMTAVY